MRKQWQQELGTKFYLPARVLDSQAFNSIREDGISNPFDSQDKLVICSYHFASAKSPEVSRVPWDLVVIECQIVIFTCVPDRYGNVGEATVVAIG